MSLSAHFEQGTDLNEVNVSDAGGPDAFDVCVADGIALTNCYDIAHARGLLSCRFKTDASGDQVAYNEWTTSYTTNTDSYDRFYLYLGGTPVNNSVIASRVLSGDNGCRIRTDADGKIRIADAAGVTKATSGSALPTGQWVRMDWHVVHSATVGSMELRVYTTDPEAAVADYDYVLTSSSINTGVSAQGFRFGWCLSNASQPQMWIDAVGTGKTDTWWGAAGEEPDRIVTDFVAFPSAIEGTATNATLVDYNNTLKEAANRLQFTSSVAYEGQLSLKCEVRTDDYDHDDLTERCEFYNTGITYTPGQNIWFALAIYLDTTFPSVQSPLWQLIHQFFGETGGESTGSPPIALEIDDDMFSLTVRGGSKADAGADAPKENFYPLAAATTGHWHEFLINAQLEKDETGYTKCWHRVHGGVTDSEFPTDPQGDDSGENVLTVNGVDQWVFCETGLYRHTRPETGIAYYGVVGVKPTREDAVALFPAVTPPPRNPHYRPLVYLSPDTSPEGVLTANPGVTVVTTGGKVYIKRTGKGNTGWVRKTP